MLELLYKESKNELSSGTSHDGHYDAIVKMPVSLSVTKVNVLIILSQCRSPPRFKHPSLTHAHILLSLSCLIDHVYLYLVFVASSRQASRRREMLEPIPCLEPTPFLEPSCMSLILLDIA